jgi:hypothetical protein
MGTREAEQSSLWIATSELPKSPGHPFYRRLNALLDAHDFDRFVEDRCRPFYAPVMGRPCLTPGRYFRLLLVGYFEGIDAERGIAWRASVEPALRHTLLLAEDRLQCRADVGKVSVAEAARYSNDEGRLHVVGDRFRERRLRQARPLPVSNQ